MSDGLLQRLAKTTLKAPIHLYRWTLKPLMGLECRHLPTCSEYGLDAIDRNGAWRGFWLTLSRVLRCNPWGSAGYDPAPDISKEHYPFAPWRYGRWTGRHIGRSEAWSDAKTCQRCSAPRMQEGRYEKRRPGGDPGGV